MHHVVKKSCEFVMIIKPHKIIRFSCFVYGRNPIDNGAKPVAMFTHALRKAVMHSYGGLQYLTPLVIVEPVV